MGRYSAPLAPQLADLAGVAGGQRVLDVGCGPGALTAELVAALGAGGRGGGRPVGAVRRRGARAAPGCRRPAGGGRGAAVRGRRVRRGARAARRPLHGRPGRAGCGEMGRVTRAGRRRRGVRLGPRRRTGPLSPFWDAARELDPEVDDESALRGRARGPPRELFARGGAARHRGDGARRRRRAPELRGVVGAVHARRRPGGGVSRRARPGGAGAAARALPRAAARRPGRHRPRVGGARPGLGEPEETR